MYSRLITALLSDEPEKAPQVVSMDVPFLIRLCEYVREDLIHDIPSEDLADEYLHFLLEEATRLSVETGQPLSMSQYEEMVNLAKKRFGDSHV